MANTFLVLRYVALTLFVLFSSAICIVAALDLGSLAPKTPRSPEIDSYLIFIGILGIFIALPVIFIERIRKNAFISRVSVEVIWVALLWVMHLSGAAAVTAIAPQIQCSASGPRIPLDCAATKALLAFTWLSTITLLSYLLGLLICSIQHHHADGQVWRTGVCDYPWFHPQSLESPDESPFGYGRLPEARMAHPVPIIPYARQIGLAVDYTVEPLTLETRVERAVPPIPAALPAPQLPRTRETRRPPPPPPVSMFPSNSLSLYPQHLQATVGIVPASPPNRASGRSPPPAGDWPRSNPPEPLPRKQRPTIKAAPVSAVPPAPRQTELVQREIQLPTLSTARSKPSGPRVASHRTRPPPLDLSGLASYNETRK